MFGLSSPEPTGFAKTLQALMERLAAPDLTAAEAQDLRPRLLSLLDSLDDVRVAPSFPVTDHPVVRGTERCAVA